MSFSQIVQVGTHTSQILSPIYLIILLLLLYHIVFNHLGQGHCLTILFIARFLLTDLEGRGYDTIMSHPSDRIEIEQDKVKSPGTSSIGIAFKRNWIVDSVIRRVDRFVIFLPFLSLVGTLLPQSFRL